MGFETFDRLSHFRDREELQTGTRADELQRLLDELDGLDERTPTDTCNAKQTRDALRNRKRMWNAIIASAGERYRNASLKNYDHPSAPQAEAVSTVRDYLTELDRSPEQARNLIFIGPPGTGKDHLMMAVLRYAVHRFGSVSAWVDGQAWFSAVRDAYASDQTETPLITFARRSDLFAISDPIPSNGAITEHQRNILFQLIDGRYRSMRPTLATLNIATREELNNRLGDSLADRLCEDAVVVPCNWQSYRQTARRKVSA